MSLTWCWQWRYSVFASLFDLRAAVPADEARLRGWFPWVSTGGNFDLWGEQASGSSWEIQVWWCCTRWRWTKASWFERKKGGKTIWSKFEPVRICNRCNLLRIRRCLHCLEPCLQEVFGRVGTKRNLSGFSYQATRNMATFIPCAYPLHWMLMLNTDTGCICILGAYNAVYHSYHASDW